MGGRFLLFFKYIHSRILQVLNKVGLSSDKINKQDRTQHVCQHVRSRHATEYDEDHVPHRHAIP